MKNVAGIFDNKIMVDRSVAELLDADFTKDDLSLIMSEQTRNKLFSSTDDEVNRVAKGAASGAVLGTALGALIAGLTAAGTLVTSGGALLVSGPIVAVLSGAGVGAVSGGIAGALIREGFAATEAKRYEEEINRGKAIVIVHASDDNKAFTARNTLQNAGATTKAA